MSGCGSSRTVFQQPHQTRISVCMQSSNFANYDRAASYQFAAVHKSVQIRRSQTAQKH